MSGGSPPHEDLLEEALADLGRAIRSRAAEGAAEGGTDWLGLLDELRRSAHKLGMRERRGEIDAFGFDPDLLESARPLLRLLRERWWRVEVRGMQRLPDAGPVLLVANRAGLLPWDGLMIAEVVEEATAGRDRPRFLVADWLITLPFAQLALARLGGVRACPENAARLLASGRSVVAFPEGQKGAAKVFAERYRLQRFGRGGVVRLALQADVPLLPVAVVGSEEVHPVLFKVETLARSAGLPFLPVTPTFPWLGPLGMIPLPSKWSIHVGAPLETAGLGPGAALDDLLIARLTEQLRAELQQMVDAGVRARSGIFG